MSRPRSSVPNQWAALGPPFCVAVWSPGSWRGRTPAKIAPKTTSATKLRQTQKNHPSFGRRRAPSPVATSSVTASTAGGAPVACVPRAAAAGSLTGDPRVDDGEEEVDDEVEDDDGHRDDEHHPLDDDVVVLLDRHHQLVAQTGQGQQVLHDEGP